MELEEALKETEIDAQVKAENGACENGEIDEKSQDPESGSISLNLGILLE